MNIPSTRSQFSQRPALALAVLVVFMLAQVCHLTMHLVEARRQNPSTVVHQTDVCGLCLALHGMGLGNPSACVPKAAGCVYLTPTVQPAGWLPHRRQHALWLRGPPSHS
jgi:hypothetical protein